MNLVKALREHAENDIEECDSMIVEDPLAMHISSLAANRIEQQEYKLLLIKGIVEEWGRENGEISVSAMRDIRRLVQ